MRLLHYLEIQNFKRFGDKQRIELEHPAVLIGPNNCGKTTAIQAIALWSQAVKSWCEVRKDSNAKERPGTPLNRLAIVAVPVRRTRYFWHNTTVRVGNSAVPMVITVGVLHENRVEPVTMRFRNDGEDLVYCQPDEATTERLDLLRAASQLNVELLYPMSGLETEEPVLQPGRIDVLLGQGQTAQVLRNLCLLVFRESAARWREVTALVRRLFSIDLGDPQETARGSIDLFYRQDEVKEPLDVAQSGRGLQQMLLILAYLYSHRRSILLIDEPDAHLEVLRQKQVYVLLRDIAARNDSQVVMVTHSEVILDEALDHNLTLLLDGKADDLAAKKDIRNALKHFGTSHYVKARERGHVLYVEGGTDLDMLRALAERCGHPLAKAWDERVNVFYVENNYPDRPLEEELERVEGGFGVTPKQHFFAMRQMVPGLVGLAILDNDGRNRQDSDEGGLRSLYWRRYEAENYFVTPHVLRACVTDHYREQTLFQGYRKECDEVLDRLVRERVFRDDEADFGTWRSAPKDAARLIWEARTEHLKLSDFAEEFFRRLADRLGHAMILRKGGLHRLLAFVDPQALPPEVSAKLDLLLDLFRRARPTSTPAGDSDRDRQGGPA
ncbi:MAG: ATP-binding protein [Planctomycetes bacterium]|jgi:ABC-type multidrug transport system ATPase subunit|nr:ATP-binding protein [Planctomycetota bacterium]